MSAQTISPEELAPSNASPLAEKRSSIGSRHNQDEADLERVRELLLGDQRHRNAEQFQALEHQLTRFKTEFEGRLERLETIVNKGFDSITQQIQAEREDRQAAIAATGQSLEKVEDDIIQNQIQINQRLNSEAYALKQKILEASGQLSDSLQQKSLDFQRDINQESQRRQQQERAYKSRISALFGELSERLLDET